MDSLYEDVVLLIEQQKLGPVHFAGLSMGGFVGMRLAKGNINTLCDRLI
jgi:pimeloyl-ACP methyl ester carboxylesterase